MSQQLAHRQVYELVRTENLILFFNILHSTGLTEGFEKKYECQSADMANVAASFLTGLTQHMLFAKPWIWADQVAAMVKVLHLTNFAHLNLLDEDIGGDVARMCCYTSKAEPAVSTRIRFWTMIIMIIMMMMMMMVMVMVVVGLAQDTVMRCRNFNRPIAIFPGSPSQDSRSPLGVAVESGQVAP